MLKEDQHWVLIEGIVMQWANPLSDPLGGTAMLNGRHQVKLFELKPG
jgi:hypothetical protein